MNARGLIACAWATAALNAAAQSYPSRAIRVVIPYPPGGGSDMLIRPIAARVSESIGQQFIMDNRLGGGSVIGTQLTARSAPDGYTALIVDLAYYANPALLAKLPYDSVRDLVPVVNLASSTAILVVHPSLPARKAAVPNVPTFTKAGLSGIEATTHRGLLVAAGTHADAIAKLNTEFNKALANAALRTRLDELGYDPTGGGIDDYVKVVRAEIAKWDGVIRKANIRVE